MSNVIVTARTTIDIKAEKLQPFFGTDLKVTDPYWYCVECEESVGGEPGFARIVIPNTAGVVDESCYTVAYNPDGPALQIKHGTPVAIQRRYYDVTSGAVVSSKLWVGKVEDVEHHPENNSLEIIAFTSHMDLKDVRVYGRYIWNPYNGPNGDQAGKVEYQHGWSSHFNPKGMPNRLYTPCGTACFAPYPNFGLSADQAPIDSSAVQFDTDKFTKAGYWSLDDMLSYFRAGWAADAPEDNLFAAARTLASATFPTIKRFPSTVFWPVGFGSSLDVISKANFNNAVGQNNSIQGGMRKGRDLQVRGNSFIGEGGQQGIFDQVFGAAGGWTWSLDAYGDNGAGLLHGLSAKQSRWIGGGVDIPIAVGGAAKDVLKSPVITRSDYKESSRHTISSVVAHGSLIKIETRCSSRAADHGGTAALLPAWTQADYNAMITAAVVGGVATADTFEKAAAQYWWVMTTWKLNPAFDFQVGTSESGMPRAQICRPLWPTLLSFTGSTSAATDITPYPIRFEVYDGSAWALGPEANGLEIWDNGTIFAPGLRDIVVQSLNTKKGAFRWNGSEYGVSGGKLDITVNDVRATIVIPCDHRLEYAVQTLAQVSATAASAGYATLDDAPHIDRLDPSFNRGAYVDLNGLYECWLRKTSYLSPQSAGGTVATDLADKSDSDTTLRSDLGGDNNPPDLLQGHGNRFLIERFGLSCEGGWSFDGTLIDAYPLGTSVNSLVPKGGATDRKPVLVHRVISRRKWTSSPAVDENGRDIFKNSLKIFPC